MKIKKSSKILLRIASVFMPMVIFLFGSVYAIANWTVDPVSSLVATEVGETYVSLQWESLRNTGGYRVYKRDAGTPLYTRVATINNGNTTEHTVSELAPGENYTFRIVSFTNVLGLRRESVRSDSVEVYTLPVIGRIERVFEAGHRALTVAWVAEHNSHGYLLEYSKNRDFFDSVVVDVVRESDVQEYSYTISDLEVFATYHFRVKAYIEFDGERLYSSHSPMVKATVAPPINRAAVDADSPMIALTFDDGPHPIGMTYRILNTLQRHNARATFFVVGRNARNRPDLVQRMLKEGHEVGNHTYTHEQFGSDVSARNITRASDVLERITGRRPTIFRSPGGMTTDEIRVVCLEEGMALFHWSLDTNDWRHRNWRRTFRTIMQAQDGDIILMHDIYRSTARAVRRAVPRLIEEGFQLVTVTELIEARTGRKPQAGVQYVDAGTTN